MKWPNDVLCDGLKVAGILLEASVRDGRLASLVVGVGVDVHAASFPPELLSIATSLALLGASDRDRSALAAGIVARVAAAAQVFGREGLAPFLAEVRQRDALAGRRVRIDGEPGLVRGLDDGGRLLVERADGAIEAVLAGHVELG